MIAERLHTILSESFNPSFIDVVDESHKHALATSGTPTHFKIIVVSSQFENCTLLKRHRMVNEKIRDVVAGLRAVSLSTLTPTEWETTGFHNDMRSPTCRGGG